MLPVSSFTLVPIRKSNIKTCCFHDHAFCPETIDKFIIINRGNKVNNIRPRKRSWLFKMNFHKNIRAWFNFNFRDVFIKILFMPKRINAVLENQLIIR